MTTTYHTPIPSSPPQPANAATINGPLAELDAELFSQNARIDSLEADMPVPSGSPTEYYDGDGNWTVPAGTGAGVDGHVIQDKGVDMVQRAKINFVGAGVTVTNEAGGTQVDIPGSSDSVTKDGLTSWDEQASNPPTPASGKWKLFFKAGGLYILDDTGAVIGPVTVDHSALAGLGDDDHPQYLQKTFVDTIIKGLKIIWNSGTSISVDVGACYAENGDFINVTSVLTASSLSLSNSTWYHVYVYLSGGSPAMEVVTTAPAAWKSDAYSKTGNTGRRYVFSLKTDGSGNVYKFVHDSNLNAVYYKKFAANTSPFRCLNAGTAATATAVALSGIIPLTAEAASIRVTNTGDNFFRTSDDNGVTSTQNTVTLSAGNSATQNGFLEHPTDSSQQIWYKYDSTPGVGGGFIDVLGYYFKR